MSEFFRVDSVPVHVLAQLLVLGIPLPIWCYKLGDKIRIAMARRNPAMLFMRKYAAFPPMPLETRPLPFDHPEYIFELKYDGFRALAVIEHGRARLLSRNGNPFASFTDLARDIAADVPNTSLTVLDGEIARINSSVGHQQG